MNKVLSRENNVIELILPPSQKAEVLVIGVTHGDEPQGLYLINKYLELYKDSTNLMFIPCLNPDGMKNSSRVNSNGVDINRNFPTSNWKKTQKDEFWGGEFAGSEIETQFVVDVINKYLPKLILTLHAPFKIVNYDGDARVYADEISKLVNYPVQSDIGYPTPGSFGTYAGLEKKIPTITLELDEECDVEDLITPVFNVFKYFETVIL